MVILFHGNALPYFLFENIVKKSMVRLLPYRSIQYYHGMPTPVHHPWTACIINFYCFLSLKILSFFLFRTKKTNERKSLEDIFENLLSKTPVQIYTCIKILYVQGLYNAHIGFLYIGTGILSDRSVFFTFYLVLSRVYYQIKSVLSSQ